jgi:protein-S-isoprenylcysteine O-methyltransferase Ste14
MPALTDKTDNTASDNPGVIARPPLLYFGALVALIVLRSVQPMPILASASVALYAGIVLGTAAICLGLWAVMTMRSAGTNVDPHRESTTVVTAGPFRYTRNPIYVGFDLLFVGCMLALNDWWGAVLLVPLAVVMHVGVIRREERYLEQKFGGDYLRYKNDVARYVG